MATSSMTVDLSIVIQLAMFLMGIFLSAVLYFLKAEQARMVAGIEKAERLAVDANIKAERLIGEKVDAVEKHRIRPLEIAANEVRDAVSAMRAEMIKLFGDLKLELVKSHPTRDDINQTMATHTERLTRIEDDVRELLDKVAGGAQRREKQSARSR